MVEPNLVKCLDACAKPIVADAASVMAVAAAAELKDVLRRTEVAGSARLTAVARSAICPNAMSGSQRAVSFAPSMAWCLTPAPQCACDE